MPSNIGAIEPNRVLLKGADGSVEALQNDAVIAQIGGTAPADLLKTFGINLVTKYGER